MPLCCMPRILACNVVTAHLWCMPKTSQQARYAYAHSATLGRGESRHCLAHAKHLCCAYTRRERHPRNTRCMVVASIRSGSGQPMSNESSSSLDAAASMPLEHVVGCLVWICVLGLVSQSCWLDVWCGFVCWVWLAKVTVD